MGAAAGAAADRLQGSLVSSVPEDAGDADERAHASGPHRTTMRCVEGLVTRGRHLVRALAVACVAALPLIAQASADADADARSACAAKQGRTLIQNRSGRVYLTARAVYACPRGARTPYTVGPQWTPEVSSSGGGGVLRVALNGRRVAYSWEQNQAFGGNYAGLNVRYIGSRRDGFRRVYDSASRAAGQPTDPQARDFVLCAGGQLAFIAGYRSQTPSGAPAEYELRVSKGRHTVLLDAGPGVQPGTLRASSGRLSWINDGSAIQTATQCERPMKSVAVPRMTVDQLFGD